MTDTAEGLLIESLVKLEAAGVTNLAKRIDTYLKTGGWIRVEDQLPDSQPYPLATPTEVAREGVK